MPSNTGLVDRILSEIRYYTAHEDDLTAVLANVAAVLKAQRPHYSWVGFYVFTDQPAEMVLGPYQGPPTCTTRIPLSAGICGLAARERKTIVIPDVRSDSRYIACSPTVLSEIVVPLLDGGRVLGVLDVDSDALDVFNVEDQALLEAAAGYIVDNHWRHKMSHES